MLPATLAKIRDDVYDILWNSKDYFYVSNYRYDHFYFEMPKYSPSSYLEDLITAFAPHVRDFATAEEFAKFVISCLSSVIAVDMVVAHCVKSNKIFNVQSADGYIDEVKVSRAGKFSQPQIRIYLPILWKNSGARAAGLVITFEYTKDILDGSYLDLPMTMEIITARGSATEMTTVKKLSAQLIQDLLDQVKF